ncbi:two-component system sensor histidine kinase NtrB [Desulfohalobium retbaense]|uniref:histidine kinase n=1 Tax=Desulfohalobium retbaense (strain ATCC 49708 / DSM 5692 / JCM 16813 / HR100) TaxID=485915 RepID=C8WZL1_DESRD|nr:ATP-binding protein [Desulfohalobium retbaense]ACV67486.1 signal transduction histidine kinase, nitrogen specific, NtrB [Desulfohalobium retbaense DSM 5692]
MATPPTAPASTETTASALGSDDRHRLVLAAGIVRLVCLGLLLIPQALIWGGDTTPEFMFRYGGEVLYTVALVAGFLLNIVFLLSWKRFVSTSWLVGTQLGTDIVLALVLVVLTGGVSSPFTFLFWGIVFFHGRVLGRRPSLAIGVGVAVLMGGLGAVQVVWPEIWHLQGAPGQLGYYLSLQWVGLGLVILLVRSSRSETEKLFARLRRQEQALEEAEALKAKVLDWMDSGLMVLNTRGEVTSANRQALLMAGEHRLDSVLGRPLRDVFPAFDPYWQKWRHDGRRERDEVQDPDQRVYGVRMLLAPDQQSTLVLFADITEIRRLEQRVREMEKMATIGELAAGLAHEMKNPLAGIKAGLQLAEQGDVPPEQLHRLHGVVQRDIGRLDVLLRDFLNYARPNPPQPESVEIEDVVEDVLSVCRYEFPGVDFAVARGVGRETWWADRHHLHQVLLNLVRNAAESVASQGHGLVRVEQLADEEGRGLAVVDSGSGILPGQERKIFDPFVTTKEQGSGLGLSIAQRLAHQNRCWIELRNAAGGGGEARLVYESTIPVFGER